MKRVVFLLVLATLVLVIGLFVNRTAGQISVGVLFVAWLLCCDSRLSEIDEGK